MRRLLFLALTILALAVPATASAEPAPWAEDGPSRGEDLTIYLVTFGHGDDIASWFGHTALLVHDEARRKQRIYNYGMFNFGPDLLPKFLMGRLEFWVGEANVPTTIRLYRSLNRDIIMSELNLTPQKRRELAAFLAWNVLPENRNYLYHHYFDNCATRIRDAIDDAVDGQLKEETMDAGRYSLRDHTHLHTQRNAYIDILLSMWMNDDIDAPIAEWDEMFLPSELHQQVARLEYVNPEGEKIPLVDDEKVVFEADRDPVPATPRTLWPYTGLFGLLLGGLGFWFARRYEETDRRRWRWLLGGHHLLAGLLFGIPGLVAVLFHFSDHTVTYWNENILLWSPFTFMALVTAFPIMRGRRWAMRTMRTCWYILAATSLFALLLKPLPSFDQGNWFAIAMLLPFNVLMAAAMHRFGPLPSRGDVRQVDDGLWVVDSTRRFLDLELGSRMTIVRLEDGSLWLHSPIAIDDELRAQIDELGEVRHLVGPNKFHHMHLGEWAEAYPDALLYGAPGLPSKRTDLDFDHELGETAPAAWADDLEQHVFEGAPMVGEVAFFHPDTKTLIVADLAENFGSSDHLPTRIYLKVMGVENEFGLSPIVKAGFNDREAAKRSVEHVLEWNFERITMCHGTIVEEDARRLWTDSYEWLSDH